MIKKLQDDYSPKGQTLFAIFGWKIGEQEDIPNLPKTWRRLPSSGRPLELVIHLPKSSSTITYATALSFFISAAISEFNVCTAFPFFTPAAISGFNLPLHSILPSSWNNFIKWYSKPGSASRSS
ncbi:hypothetical protein LR48_Vigan07g131800 [Vigna angularis]|uniref:Uncharacterized protein n=1 Tax=Phaseolus angularis TaxID=3914 RepID=A0A0L9UYJ6_PHAAN|nr:hypothetical protein LR48_Vigan07g131800 [Vigna angularis]